jgi:Putative transposase/Transposase zinc-binding domain
VSARPKLEVADVIRGHGEAYRRWRGGKLSSAEAYVLRSLAACRTAVLGGHLEQCGACGHRRPAYNSCRNRHCPKCQGAARAAWLDARRAELLPVPYFHVVFTLPDQLSRLALQNKEVLYNLLFRAAAETLQEVAATAKHLGAEIGLLAVLHTWGQNLLDHPHLHCVVPGGGLSPDGSRWIACRKEDFFLPVRVLSAVFRGKFLDGLKRAFHQGKLAFCGRLAELARPDAFHGLVAECYQRKWVVYAKPPFGGPEQVLKYLARYTHRVAISNRRLISIEDGLVTFRWKNYADGGRRQTMTLAAVEFLRRFLLHVLPSHFVRIRHYGLLANRHRAKKLARCRELLGQSACKTPVEPLATPPADEEPANPCPLCGGRMHTVEQRPRLSGRDLLTLPWPWDTS